MSALLQVGLPWPEPEIPKYRVGSYGRWSIDRYPAAKGIAGYFLPAPYQPSGWVIKHDNRNTWMSITRMEIESHMPHLAAAEGHVVIMGLGMGFALYNIAKNPKVTKVTVVEHDLNIVGMMDKATKWRSWPGHEKVELVVANALTYQTDEEVDFLYADIWRHLGAHEALEQTQQIQHNIGAKTVGFWGQEWDYVSWSADKGITGPSLPKYRKFARDVALPLIEQKSSRYPHLAYAAVTLQIAAKEPEPAKSKLLGRYWMYATADDLDQLDQLLYHAV